MSSKRYSEEFKIETVKQITEVVIAGQAEAAAVCPAPLFRGS